MPSARVPLILGASGFGVTGTSATRVHDLETCQKLIDIFTIDHGYKAIDTSRVYGEGTSEEYLGKLDIHGGVIDTKTHPRANPTGLKANEVRESLLKSIKAMPNHKIRIFYLHYPDRDTPVAETLGEINKLHKEGLFEEFGLSNYGSWEVAEIYMICKERGYVLPTVYQGPYNILQRASEPELFPALRKYNMKFAAWSPLAGGVLSGSIQTKDDPVEAGSRLDPNTYIGRLFRTMFTDAAQLEAVEELLKPLATKHNLTIAEISLRWLQHHSKLGPEDAVIIGGSKAEHIENNCTDSEKGPLPDDVVKATEEVWAKVKAQAPSYYTPPA